MNNLDALLEKIKQYSATAGKAGAGMALTLYYVLASPQTSVANKAIIGAALAYQFLPNQILTREKNGVLGIADNIITLTIAYNRIKASITPEITAQVEAKLLEWGFTA